MPGIFSPQIKGAVIGWKRHEVKLPFNIALIEFWYDSETQSMAFKSLLYICFGTAGYQDLQSLGLLLGALSFSKAGSNNRNISVELRSHSSRASTTITSS